MSLNIVQNEVKKMSTDNEQSIASTTPTGKVKATLKDKLTVISAFSAVLAALLSAFVSLWVASIQTDVEELVASKKDTVERAVLFKDLINDLNNEKKAGYALLTLWKVYQQENDRKIVVLAALESPDPNKKLIQTLKRLGFDKELAKYAKTFTNQAILGTGEASKAASNIILETFPPLQKAEYLVAQIEHNEVSGPNDVSVTRLIELIAFNKDVKEMVNENAARSDNINLIIAYAQYKTSNKKAFIKYLKEVKDKPEQYGEYMNLVSELKESEFADNDWLMVAEATIDILKNKGALLESFMISAAFNVIGSNKLLKYKKNAALKKNILQVSQEYILRGNVQDIDRYAALRSLQNWNPVEALKVIAQHRACGNEFGPLTTVFVEDILDVEEVKNVKPPKVDAGTEKWKQWFKVMNQNNDVICKV